MNFTGGPSDSGFVEAQEAQDEHFEEVGRTLIVCASFSHDSLLAFSVRLCGGWSLLNG
jgi:hypothetical protein